MEDARVRLAGLLAAHANDPEFEISSDDWPALARRELRDWIRKGLLAERQQRSLVPVRDGGRQLEQCVEALELRESLKRLLPGWVAENGYRLWNERVETCETDLAGKKSAFEGAQAKRDEESAWRGAIERALGGNRLRLLVPEGRLMDAPTFARHATDKAVVEPESADIHESGLSPEEHDLFLNLRSLPKGRLEQEFIPAPEVHEAVSRWAENL